MPKPITAVAFRQDAPVEFFEHHMKLIESSGGPIRVMDCTEVSETHYGFLRLVPKAAIEGGEMGIYVPPSYILWMLRAPVENRPGFV